MEKITKYLAGECSEQERLEVEEWKNASSDNLKKFERFEKTWKMAEKTQCLFQPNVENAWQQMKVCINKKKTKMLNFYQWASIAAVFIGILTLSYVFFVPENQPTIQYQIVTTGSDKQSTPIVLSDGTKIWLNAHSELKYPLEFTEAKRMVTLKGEAFFDVAKNPAKPFQISLANDAKVEVLGTSFNINTQREDIEVDVFTGKVAFGKENPIYLTKGMKGIFDRNTEKLVSEKFDENSLAWKTGILTFKNAPLEKIIQQLSNYYQIPLSLKDKSYQEKELNITFDNQTVEESIELLELTLNKEHIIQKQK